MPPCDAATDYFGEKTLLYMFITIMRKSARKTWQIVIVIKSAKTLKYKKYISLHVYPSTRIRCDKTQSSQQTVQNNEHVEKESFEKQKQLAVMNYTRNKERNLPTNFTETSRMC